MNRRAPIAAPGLLWALVTALGCGGDAAAPSGEQASTTGAPTAAAPAADTLHPRLRVLTNQGAITVELDAEHAPISVSNFIGYVDAGHYVGTVFHQVEPGFIAAAGGYNEQLAEKVVPQRPIRNEADNGLKNVRGTIACARSPDVIDSTTSQFFFNLADNGQLDHSGREPAEYGYCVFGKVVDGLEVLDKIAAAPSGPKGDLPNVPQQAIVIERVTRVR
jgi:cyclophilin family peptidyl-prolyl cis-trans isomerase